MAGGIWEENYFGSTGAMAVSKIPHCLRPLVWTAANRQHSFFFFQRSFYHIGFPEQKKTPSLFVCLVLEINAQSVVHLSISQMGQKYQQLFFFNSSLNVVGKRLSFLGLKKHKSKWTFTKLYFIYHLTYICYLKCTCLHVTLLESSITGCWKISMASGSPILAIRDTSSQSESSNPSSLSCVSDTFANAKLFFHYFIMPRLLGGQHQSCACRHELKPIFPWVVINPNFSCHQGTSTLIPWAVSKWPWSCLHNTAQ